MNNLEEHLKKIAALEKHRDEQREKMNELLEKKKTVEQEIKNLEIVLVDLDERLEALEEQCLPQGQEQQVKVEPSMNQTLHEDLTSYTQASSMRNPDEVLTDPWTQVPNMPARKPPRVSLDTHHAPAQEEELTLSNSPPLKIPPRTASISSASVGQLEITKLPAKKKKAPPAASKANGTLDQFFGLNASTLTKNPPQSAQNSARTPILAASGNNSAGQIRSSDNRFNKTFPWSERVQHMLQSTFRIQHFREHQEEVINCTLSGEDVFVLMRTGGGKSLTYQLPALLEARQSGKVTLVISPLLSLIKDQEDQMNQFAPGSAVSFSSSLPGGQTEQARRWDLVRNASQGVCMVFVTPEKVHKSNKLKSELQKLQHQGRLGRFVIDEAHCCSNWGHDFRPDYTKLGLLRSHFPGVPIMAVTATASDRVREDVCDILNMSRNCAFFRSSSNRPNLRYEIRSKRSGDAVLDDMASFIKEEYPHSAGIVYTLSRKDADTVADKLLDRGIVAASYHSDVSQSQKDAIHQSWMRNATQVVVATIAFGLGINKPDVSFVLHHSLSKSLEAYYQESGRAGRDGNPARCILYYCPKDVMRMIKMIHRDAGGSQTAFWQMVKYAQEGGGDAVCRNIILAAMGEERSDVEAFEAARQKDEAEGSQAWERRDVGQHAKTVTQLLRHYGGENLTMNMLVKEWRAKGNVAACVADNPPGKELTPEECERVVVALLARDVFKVRVIYNSYDSVVYLNLGVKSSHLLAKADPKFVVAFPKREGKKSAEEVTKRKARKAVADEDGWLTTKKPFKKNGSKSSSVATKKKITSKKATTTRKRKQSAVVKSKPRARKKQAKINDSKIDVIELSSSEDETVPETVASSRPPRAARKAASLAIRNGVGDDPSSSPTDSDEECEFDG